MPKKNKDSRFYVDNKKFTTEMIKYHTQCNIAKEEGLEIPKPSDYIGDCIYRICTGISVKPNFVGYSYRDMMVSDALLRCVNALPNFNPDAKTRTGKPNAHAYFSQIAYFAMIKRIKDEKKEAQDRRNYIRSTGIEAFIDPGDSDTMNEAAGYLDIVRKNIDQYEYDLESDKTDYYGWTPPSKDEEEEELIESEIEEDNL